MFLRSSIISILLAMCGSAIHAQPAKDAPAGDTNPIPTLEAGGPISAITALAFSPDATTLYSAGYDKIVRVWRRGADGKTLQLDDRTAYRVPIGPGRDGVINVLAVSPDGQWLAVSGLGVYRGASGFAQPGWIVPEASLTPEMRRERFAIYMFDIKSRAVALLRGHEEDVLGLTFAPEQPGQSPLLVSVGRKPGTTAGRVCVWRADQAAKVNDKGELVEPEARIQDWKQTDIGPVPGEPPPGLAVRSIGNGHFRVLTAWGDGKLRIREFGPNDVVPSAESVDEPRNADGKPAEYTQAVLAAPGRILTSGFVRGKGYVQTWTEPAGQSPTPGQLVELLPPPGVSVVLPRAMCLLSSGDGRGLDLAALVLRSPARNGSGQEYRLGVLNLRDLRMVARSDADAVLGMWTKPPVVAASPDGQYLAISGDENRELRVLSTSDLMGSRPEAKPLRNGGAQVGAAAFVIRDPAKEMGLALRQTADPIRSLAANDLILDSNSGSLSPTSVGWRLDSPAGAGWRVNLDPNSPDVFQWIGPQSRGGFRLILESAQTVTAYALIPPRAPVREPTLAVATWDAKIGEPVLMLRNATNGKRLRQLNGHVQPIRSLAASGDGRLLVSTSDDQTVSVWSMTDLGEIVGQHGALHGITMRAGDKSCVIAQVDADGAMARELMPDDIIESVAYSAADRKPKAIASPLELFEALWSEKPGESVQLNLRRGGRPLSVKVTLDQAIDERKPLASVFVSRDQQPQWIAWSPQGPYDVSARDAERFLGWHFNPSRAGEPVRFAQADAYRERLHKSGLLKSLLLHANLTDAIRELDRPVAVPRPTIFCSVDAADPVRFAGGAAEQILVRQSRANLRMRIQGPSIGKNEVESVSWRMNDGEFKSLALDRADGDTLTQAIDLGTRGIARMQVRVRTREVEPQQVTRDLVLRYQPAAPHVTVKSPAESRIVVREPQFRLQAAVQPATPNQKVVAAFRHGGSEPKPVGMQIDESVTLTPGENVLEVRATNDGALRGFEDDETDRRTIVVVLQTKETPQITFASLAEISPIAPPGAEIRIEPGRPIVTSARVVRIQGRILGKEPLALAQLGDKSLAGFRPGGAAEFAFDEEVTLKPDNQSLVFRGKTASGDAAESQLIIIHRPVLPALVLTDPDPDRTLTEGKDPLEIEVRGSLTPPEGLPAAHLQPYEVVLRVINVLPVPQPDGVETIIRADKIAANGALAAKLRLQPGENRIEVIVRNRWHEGSPNERRVLYNRPPRIIGGAIKAMPAADKPFAEIVADVESATELTRIECNGREYPVNDAAKLVRDSAYRVTIPQVALVQGSNTMRLLVSNRDGPSLVEGRATLDYRPSTPKLRAKVELLNIPREAVLDPQFEARYAIQSEGSRVERIEIRRGTNVVLAIPNPQQESAGKELFRATGVSQPIALQEGANRLKFIAINGGGESEESFVVCHMPTPEWLEIDRPKSPQPQGEITLTGRVNWIGANRAAEFERKLMRLRVYVNSCFQQQTPAVRPAGPNSIEFSVHVILNRPKDNLIEVECPDLRPESGGLQRFAVDCEQPKEEPRTLHLIVLAVHPGRAEVTDKALAVRALKALQTRGGGGAEGLRSTVFQRVMMHPYSKDQPTQVVSGYVTCEHIRDALESVRRQSKPNDVAMIYWLGDEAVNENGNLYLTTSETRPGRKLAHSAISLKEILEFPRETPGACALLLDTAAGPIPADAPKTEALPSTRVAVMRYAWGTKTQAVPGLLLALEEASQKKEATSLQDLAVFAGQSIKKFGVPPSWIDNLKELPAIAQLVISRRPQ